ncbi:MAG: glycosyltransferase family 2 protein [Candidatus Omnitrophica bacterium]|nr:glycosyltransferase family 2 protein [Candidatus Omnitrophota bacterium]
MQAKARVGIVIINYNGFSFIKECLGSLAKVDYPQAQIVIVDNGSRDGSIEWVIQDFPKTQVIKLQRNLGFSAANNIGIRWCIENNCEYVLLLNNDTVVEPNFLSQIMDYVEYRSIIVPKIYCYDNKALINSNVGGFDFWRGVTTPWFYRKKDSKRSRQMQLVGMASACAVLIPRNAFTEVGFLDEKYFLYWEDTDFIVRVLAKGYVVKFVPHAVVYHKEGCSSGGRASPLAVYYNNRNRLYFMSKYKRSKVSWVFFLFYYLLGRIVYTIAYLFSGKMKELKALGLGVFDFCRGRMGYLTPEGQKVLDEN